MKKAAPHKRGHALRDRLRAMPINERAEVIVDIFRIISAEFAAMVLEHTKPAARPARAKAKK